MYLGINGIISRLLIQLFKYLFDVIMITLPFFQLAENLIRKETLNYNDVEVLIGPPPFGKKRLVEPADFEESVTQSAREYDSAATGDVNKNEEQPNSKL